MIEIESFQSFQSVLSVLSVHSVPIGIFAVGSIGFAWIGFALGSRRARASGAEDRGGVESLMAPIRESLASVDAKLAEVDAERRTQQAVMAEQLQWMSSSHQRIEDGTRDLVAALRSPSVRGRWGELQLRRTLEVAGMLARCDFSEQVRVEGRLRPDVVVHLAGGRSLVIDAKTPLEAHLTALRVESQPEREALEQRHAKQVRDHVTKLAAKRYWSALSMTPEFVVLFLPGEAIFRAALEADPELLEFAAPHKVVIASPATLIALLRAVAYGWQQADVAENAAEISRLGRELYDRVAKMTGHFDRLGRRLGGAVLAYNEAMGSLDQGVLRSARRLGELGVEGRPPTAPAAIGTRPRQEVALQSCPRTCS